MASDDPLPRALAHLDPVRRATLALLARRGLGEERVAALLGVAPDVVAERRRDALEALAAEVGRSPGETWDELLTLPAGDWPGAARAPASEPEPELVVDPEPVPESVAEPGPAAPAPAPAPAPDASDPPRRRRGMGAIAAAATLLVAALVVVVALVVADGGSSASAPAPTQAAATRPAATAAPTTTAAAPAPPTTAASAPATGPTATLAANGRTLSLRVPGLPRGDYDVWLFDTVLDSRRLGELRDDGTLTARLPAGARSFRTLDVSRQPAGLERHSGVSVVRVPVARLRAGRAVALEPPPL